VSETEFKQRLEKMADNVQRNELESIKAIPFDKWLVMSGLQKAIRRGDAALAGRMALSLWQQDKRALWRRLAVIAVEDVAMGDIETVLDVMVAVKHPTWRKDVGDASLALYLAQQMARSAKTRYLTELYLYCDHANKAAKARQWAASASFKDLASILHDTTKEAPWQALALWGLVGSTRIEAKEFKKPGGDIHEAMKIIKEMPVPEEILSICTATVGTPHFPLAILLPIGWLELQRQSKNLTTRKEMPVSSPEVDGLPMYAVDGLYTRTGIACLKELKRSVPSLNAYSNTAIGEGLFFIEAETLNPRLSCDAWGSFRQDSIAGLMQSLGVGPDDYMALQRCLIKNYDHYNDIRLAKIKALSSAMPENLI